MTKEVRERHPLRCHSGRANGVSASRNPSLGLPTPPGASGEAALWIPAFAGMTRGVREGQGGSGEDTGNGADMEKAPPPPGGATTHCLAVGP